MISSTPILNDTLWRRGSYEPKVCGLFRWPGYFAYSALLLPLVLDSCCEGSHSTVDNIALQSKNPIRTEKEFFNSRVRSFIFTINRRPISSIV